MNAAGLSSTNDCSRSRPSPWQSGVVEMTGSKSIKIYPFEALNEVLIVPPEASSSTDDVPFKASKVTHDVEQIVVLKEEPGDDGKYW
jgi:hypothetical protein